MAFTPEQETILEQIIEAFQNGKRLSDLPEVADVNPYELYTEVLDAGESKKAKLASLLPYLEEECSYGVEFDTSVSSPACTRIGNSDLHKSLPIQSRMRGCLLDDDGNVVEYLNPQSWLGQTRDGSRGQVMVEIPAHYRKFETDGTKRRVRISEVPLAGYDAVPLRYVSAYEASLDRTNNKLASVVNTSAQYRGGGNNDAWDGTFRTLLGRPATSLSLTDFRTKARNRKANSYAWNCMTYGTQKALYWLFVIEYATLNTQAAFNAQPTQDGYRQGGLGDGVTTVGSAIPSGEQHYGDETENWNTFNGYNPFVPCGHTDSLGNGTGQVEYCVQDDTTGAWEDQMVPRYRGVENPFGHIWQWTDGVLVEAGAEESNGGSGLHKVYVATDPSKFASTIGTGYAHVGNEARADGYGKAHIFGVGGEIIPSEAGGSGAGSTEFLCDYHYQNIPSSGNATRGVLFGGRALCEADAGFACATSTYTPSSTYAAVGSRLCFLPSHD